MVLRSDGLEVEAKLAQEKLKLLKTQDRLITAKETLNDLMGREIKAQLTASVSLRSLLEEGNLETAESKALEQNPQVAEAEIDVKQATNARQIAKAQYLPDLNFSIQYTTPIGYTFVPTNIANAGLEFRWEPFEWGAASTR